MGSNIADEYMSRFNQNLKIAECIHNGVALFESNFHFVNLFRHFFFPGSTVLMVIIFSPGHNNDHTLRGQCEHFNGKRTGSVKAKLTVRLVHHFRKKVMHLGNFLPHIFLLDAPLAQVVKSEENPYLILT
ncbi:hypothetical protein D3C80_1379750 [compost metagenome]